MLLAVARVDRRAGELDREGDGLGDPVDGEVTVGLVLVGRRGSRIAVEANVMVGCSSAEKKSVDRRWASRSAWLVSTSRCRWWLRIGCRQILADFEPGVDAVEAAVHVGQAQVANLEVDTGVGGVERPVAGDEREVVVVVVIGVSPFE